MLRSERALPDEKDWLPRRMAVWYRVPLRFHANVDTRNGMPALLVSSHALN